MANDATPTTPKPYVGPADPETVRARKARYNKAKSECDATLLEALQGSIVEIVAYEDLGDEHDALTALLAAENPPDLTERLEDFAWQANDALMSRNGDAIAGLPELPYVALYSDTIARINYIVALATLVAAHGGELES